MAINVTGATGTVGPLVVAKTSELRQVVFSGYLSSSSATDSAIAQLRTVATLNNLLNLFDDPQTLADVRMAVVTTTSGAISPNIFLVHPVGVTIQAGTKLWLVGLATTGQLILSAILQFEE